jgi:hypothetical protein
MNEEQVRALMSQVLTNFEDKFAHIVHSIVSEVDVVEYKHISYDCDEVERLATEGWRVDGVFGLQARLFRLARTETDAGE